MLKQVTQLHQRGKRIVLQNMIALGAATGSPILGGHISQVFGWRMQFRILIAFTVVALLFVIFACPEHAYVRESALETDMLADESDKQNPAEGRKVESSTASKTASETTKETPRTYWEELKPFNGFVTLQNPLVLLARPFVCFLYPAVFWGFTVGGLWSSWVSCHISIVAITSKNDASH
jgi:MFS family permease